RTEEDPEWTRRYHATDPAEKAFGARVVITLRDGRVLTDEIAVADAHPSGARPFGRAAYVEKFRTLADGIVATSEQDRFLDLAARIDRLSPDEVGALGLTVEPTELGADVPPGIF